MKTKLFYVVFSMLFLISACGNNRSQEAKTADDNNTVVEMTQEINSNNKNNMAKAINLTRAEFLEKVANFEKNPEKWEYLGDKPCIIDFYADWCGPCKMVAPILDELAIEYADDIYIYKVDTEVEQQLAAEFGIRSIPSMLFVPMTDQPQMAQGALPKDALKQAINEVLLKN